MFNSFVSSLGQTVNSTDLYDFLELEKTYYSRWVKKYITENPFCERGKEYLDSSASELDEQGNPIKRGSGRFRTNYLIHIDFAKKLCMVSHSKKGEEIRDYLVGLTKQVENNDLLTHDQVIYLVQLKEVFKYVSNCKLAEDMNREAFVTEYNGTRNPFIEFHQWRNKILDLDPETIDTRIKQWCVENERNLPKKSTNKTEKLILLDMYEVVRNGVWDFLTAKGNEQAMKLANLVKNMMKVEKGEMWRQNEDTLYQQQEKENEMKRLN